MYPNIGWIVFIPITCKLLDPIWSQKSRIFEEHVFLKDILVNVSGDQNQIESAVCPVETELC